jgi:hypothetical protein
VSRNQRVGLIAAAIAIAAVAFVIASPDDTDEGAGQTETVTATEAQTETVTETRTEEARPPPPAVERISLSRGTVKGGPKRIEATTGEIVRIAVSSDASDEIHVHGYDLTKTAGPGKPARFRFKATIEGDFEVESHTAEDAGKDPLIARLQVAPD